MNERDVEAMFLKLSRLETGKRQYTDTSNAERMLAKYGKDLRYCTPWNKWLWWDETRWHKDEHGELLARGKEIVREMYGEAYRLDSDWEREALTKHAMKSEGVRRREAMVRALSWERSIWVSPGDLDRDPWLLNCANGTVDLRTGILRPHDEAITSRRSRRPTTSRGRSARGGGAFSTR